MVPIGFYLYLLRWRLSKTKFPVIPVIQSTCLTHLFTMELCEMLKVTANQNKTILVWCINLALGRESLYLALGRAFCYRGSCQWLGMIRHKKVL